MGPAEPARAGLSVRSLPPSIFAAVMATGIVSLALGGAGYHLLALALFWLNAGLYAVLSVLLLARTLRYRADLAADLASHTRAPGFFTLVAAPCVLGDQCVLMLGAGVAGLALWIVGAVFWLASTWAMVPGLMEGSAKPKAEVGLHGAWLLLVVGTQAISVLACRLVPVLVGEAPDGLLFVALVFWLVGSMGAMAISTLAGACLVGEAGRMPLLSEVLPFLKGMTLLFWATATWWIPILIALGTWRYVVKRVPLTYEHGNWAVVFPLGMYTSCSENLIRVFKLPFLDVIPAVFVWVALVAWGLTFAGLVRHLVRSLREGTMPGPPVAGAGGRGVSPPG
jgi:tellurite resistance protein TehA-like permease